MTTLAPWIEQWQYFTSDLREQFWSDLTQPPLGQAPDDQCD
jgi:hypothetical protein